MLKQVQDALANGKDLRKIKVKYQDGEVIKFDFDTYQVEEEDGEEEEDEDDEKVDEEDEDDEDEEDDDEEDEEDEEDDGEVDEEDDGEVDEEDEEEKKDGLDNNGTSSQTSSQISYQTIQAGGRKVNVINR